MQMTKRLTLTQVRSLTNAVGNTNFQTLADRYSATEEEKLEIIQLRLRIREIVDGVYR